MERERGYRRILRGATSRAARVGTRLVRDIVEEMSEDSARLDVLEISRQTREAISQGDIDTAMGFFATDAVYDLSAGGLGAFEGIEAIRSFLEDWHRSWEDYRFEEVELLDLGHGVGLSVMRESGRLAGGRGRVDLLAAQVAICANGKVEWMKAYTDADEARAAAERLAHERGSASRA